MKAVLFSLVFLFGCIAQQYPETNTTNNGTSIPNPASKYCIDNHGTLTIFNSPDGQYGVCEFSSGAKCEEWAYFRGECSPEKPNFCVTDADCACGTHIKTGECFVGSRDFVNVDIQCPDYCTGIAGMFDTKCVNHQCKIVKKNQVDGFCGKSTYGPCNTDDDCLSGGCSGQVCQSKAEEPVITTCEYRACYNPQPYGLQCICFENKCQWN